MSIRRFWAVTCNIPIESERRPGYSYPSTAALGVLAATAGEAIAAVLAAHPGAEVWAVNHKGKVDLRAGEGD